MVAWRVWPVVLSLLLVAGGAGGSERGEGSREWSLTVTGSALYPGHILVQDVRGGTHGLQLPASFVGVLPCADCPGISHHLDLWPDNLFHLRREWLEREHRFDGLDRWRYEPDRRAIVLSGGTEMPLQFEVIGPAELRLLHLEGRPIDSKLDYGLRSDGSLTPTDLELLFGGELQYMADAAVFTECLTGRRYPVAIEGDWIQVERAYLEKAPEPGGPLYTTFEGMLTDRPKTDGEGTERTLVVKRFVNVWPGQACPPPLDAWERALEEALEKALRFRIAAQTLECYDNAGASLALLEAVYLR